MMSIIPRGMRDYLPEETEKFERIRDEFRQACSLYGFKMMEPSPLEMLSTLEAKSGPAIRDEIYHFRDKGGRKGVSPKFRPQLGLKKNTTRKRRCSLAKKVGRPAWSFKLRGPATRKI